MDVESTSKALRAKAVELTKELDAIVVDEGMTPADKQAVAARLDALAARAEAELAVDARSLAGDASPEGEQARNDTAVVFRRLAMLESWTDRRPLKGPGWMDLAASFASTDALKRTIAQEKPKLEDLSVFGDVMPLLQKRRIAAARKLLRTRLAEATRPEDRARIQAFLDEPRNFLTPITAAPGMATINGIGTSLYGSRRPKDDGTYIATLYFVVLFIPIIPLSAYVVRPANPGWTFFGKVPLSAFQTWWRRLALLGPLSLIAGLIALSSWTNSAWRLESAALDKAASQLASRNAAGTLLALQPLRASRDAGRSARAAELAGRALDAALEDFHDPIDIRGFLSFADRQVLPRWVPPGWLDRLQKAATSIAPQKGGGEAVAALYEWAARAIPAFAPLKAAAAAAAGDLADSPALDSLALHWTRAAKQPAPASLLDRMERRLAAGRYPKWDVDALLFVEAVPADRGRPILFARAENAWKGKSPAGELAKLDVLPAPLKALFQLDGERILPKKVDGLLKIAEGEGLPEPQRSWHRLGAARRLSEACALLNNEDPVAWPLSKGRPWTLRARELAPEDPELRERALRALVDEGEFAKAIEIAEAAAGDPRSRIWLGIAYARSNRPEEAARILRPYVKDNLGVFVKAYESWTKDATALRKRLQASLNSGRGDQDFIRRLNRLSSEMADAELLRWLDAKVEADAGLARQAAVWRPLKSVYSAGLELAMVELGLGRALPPGEARQARLQEAERLFLELRRVSDDDPHQDLQLAQVYFWLGKDAEALALYAKLEAGGDGLLLYRMGDLSRDLGRSAEARRLLEAAYAKLQGDEKFNAAVLRAMTATDRDDQLAWLGKSDPKNSFVRAERAFLEAGQDVEEGDFEKAVERLDQAEAYYKTQPESATNLNNWALCDLLRARASGRMQHATDALRRFRRALELSRDDAILHANAIGVLEKIGSFDLCGKALRPDLLHQLPTLGWQEWIVPAPPAGEWAARVKGQAELRRAAELGPKVVLLSPERLEGYHAQIQWFWSTRDVDALRRLRTQLEASPPNRGTEEKPGQKEIKTAERKEAEKALARLPGRLDALRKAEHAPSLASGLLEAAATRLYAQARGIEKAGFADAMKDVEEARAVFDCRATRWALAHYRAHGAALSFAAQNAGFGAWKEAAPEVDLPSLLACYLSKMPGEATALRALPETRRLEADLAAYRELLTEPTAGAVWIRSLLCGGPLEEQSRKDLQRDTMPLDDAVVDWLLSPTSVQQAGEAWLFARTCGDAALAEKVAAESRRRGLLPALFGP